jgi:hypothetical protein
MEFQMAYVVLAPIIPTILVHLIERESDPLSEGWSYLVIYLLLTQKIRDWSSCTFSYSEN